MLSVVMVGRNDDYGYHPLDRARHSINLWAETLTEGEDELIWVDDNSEGKTMPEEITPQLSKKALRVLKVLKITKETHEKFGVRIPVAEYHAKNIGIRNARENWILVTNSDDFPSQRLDMTEAKDSFCLLSTIQRLPVIDWISCTASGQVLEKSRLIHERGIWKPGDFQLASRKVWEDLRGYEESLLDWGYNDSLMVNKAVHSRWPCADISSTGFKVFHLEHKTAESPARGWQYPKNHELSPKIKEQKITNNLETWGKWPVEEIKL